ncbi:Bre4p [Lachancea thermotolerans CBS 6340]|uniref:KLTH0B07810p n=1 Tax=Lachancea thermotolerans (strain ATCC 56472 / CBS 6340 / NRRL Y-8284) TaxID=559295 RepID=C5DD28_LACTC|nr:KLTH0B07810p [Lachancea thermotolerans CBS 6340]CAR21689.1 KLTH0B07810p [Lachancea thermotolerans CBS 6340]
MVDSKVSKGSYKHKSFLSLKELGQSSKNKGPPSSRTSLSQLKLNLLADGKHWEILEDYGLEELRDGFFDPIFTRHENVVPSEEDSDSAVSKTAGRLTVASWVAHNLEGLKQSWQPMLKFWLAFFIAVCICLIHPSGSWLGHRFRYFMPVAVLIHHPARNIGVQLEITLWSITGAAFGMGWSALAWYISVATRPTANHQGGILFASMFLAVFLSTWLRSSKQRLLYFSLSYGIAICFLHTVDLVNAKSMLDWKLYWDFGIPYLFGLLISMVVCAAVFPHSGQSEIISRFSTSINNIKQLLVTFLELDECGNTDRHHLLQKEIGTSIDFDVSEGMREFLNQLTITRISEESLLSFRNSITIAAAPLRSMPTDHKLLTKLELQDFYEAYQDKHKEGQTVDKSHGDTHMPVSGNATPLPKSNNFVGLGGHTNSELFTSMLRSTFSSSLLSLLVEMIALLETIESGLDNFANGKLFDNENLGIEEKLKSHISKLIRRIYNIDVCYKEFTKSNLFCKELLSDSQAIDSFLFLRYLRQSAKNLIPVATCVVEMSANLRWRVELPHYPWRRALNRLPHRCSIDQGAKSLLHYFETKSDVDDLFEQLYNSYTSRHKVSAEGPEKGKIRATVRAIDHKDFSLHTTSHPLRYKLWLLSTEITSYESRWALKIAIVMTFFALPAWLPQSNRWYQEYQCWWAPLSFLLLSNRRHSGNWPSMGRRLASALLGIFWGWCSNQARHFGSPYVVATFAGLLCAVLSFNFFANNHTKSSFTGLLCFVVIALEPYSKRSSLNTAFIWKNTWVTGVALLCGILLSIPINWILWSFTARHELRISISSLLAHISQSYQSVTDRYLYRDADDAPTELTLKYSSIREVRLSQSLIAVKRLLQKAREEPNYIFEFKADLYEQLLDACEYLLEKMVEARLSGQHFEVWDQDSNSEISRALLSLRRDSVASVIFIFYMLSNCFLSKNRIPMYLPNVIMSRKKLYDFISKFESNFASRSSTAVSNSESSDSEIKEHDTNPSSDDYEKSHWTQIHGMAFARAFTDIAEVVQKLANLSREILGEEDCC